MADFVIKQGSLVPYLPARLEDAGGHAADLTDATVRMVMATLIDGVEVINALATILVSNPADLISADQVNVAYAWSAGDTDAPGLYRVEWRVTRDGGADPETFPGVGGMLVSITRKVGGA